MIHCNACHGWRPTKWEGYQWVDTEAPCIYYDHAMNADGTCSKASITKPVAGKSANTSKPVAIRRNSTTLSPSRVEKKQLYAHQIDAIERFKDRSEAALFLEQGCGKSAIALKIAAHKYQKGEIDSLLIVAPNDLHAQWHNEQLPLWLDVPYESQCLFGRGGAKEAYQFDDDGKLHVVCVNIDTFSTPVKWKDITEWAKLQKAMIILDEATVCKNPSAKRTERILYEFNHVTRRGRAVMSSVPVSVARIILTGTPVTNGPMDLWCMCEFLKPNYFNRNWYSFQNHYGMFTRMDINGRSISVPINEETWRAIKQINSYGEALSIFGCSEDTFITIHSQDAYEGPYKHADELKKALEPIAMFKQLKDCVDLPPQVYSTRELSMSPEQQSCYDSMCAELIADYAGHTMTALNKLTAIIRLQQISSGFIYDKEFMNDTEIVDRDRSRDRVNSLFGMEDYDIAPDEIQWIGKSNPKLDTLYRDVDESAKPVIIITRFSAEAARIYEDLSRKYNCCLITGWKRVGTVDEFKEGKYEVMVANSSVISRGFNLQNSHTILFYSNTFSLETRLQAEGRIFRIGQEDVCSYVDYVFKDSVDEQIISALRLKRNLLDYIRSAEIEELVA